MLTTVGPYLMYGESLVKACIEAGTHYCDLTGETPYVMRLIEKYHETAKAKGVKIVPCSGFDSIPSDLGALFVADRIQKKYQCKTQFVRAGVKLSGGGFSGGTLASGMEVAQLPTKILVASLHPYSLNTETSKKELKGTVRKGEEMQYFTRKEKDLGITAPWLMAGINARIVRRTASLYHESDVQGKLPSKENPFGASFGYNEYMKVPNYIVGAIISIAILLVAILTKFSFLRNLLRRFIKPGQGPSEAQRQKAKFSLDFVGYGEEQNVKVRARISGGDPGYTDTAKMIAETALYLSTLNLQPQSGGILTPAVACGLELVPRLQKAGIKFEIVEESEHRN